MLEGVSGREVIEQIGRLKQQRDALILAHYYVPDEVQQIADFVGDSYFLSKKAMEAPQKTIVFCGVQFMGESAKLMNPEKTILLADAEADCPMAHMATPQEVARVRREHPDAAVVCYINSTAELKSCCDVCVTSSNAVRIVRALPQKEIFFIPDSNLAHYIAQQVPEKTFLFGTGYCHVHHSITPQMVQEAKQKYPQALFVAHPECHRDVLALADAVGSTSEIIDFASANPAQEFIIGTEMGVLYELQKRNPHKRFYPVHDRQICPNMKRNTLEKVRDALERMQPAVALPQAWSQRALRPLEQMHQLAEAAR